MQAQVGHHVEVVASLPSFAARQTDAQRGTGLFDDSIAALRRFNELGYGIEGSGLLLHLVTNPVGAFLPASQAMLERDWKRELGRRHGVSVLLALVGLWVLLGAVWLAVWPFFERQRPPVPVALLELQELETEKGRLLAEIHELQLDYETGKLVLEVIARINAELGTTAMVITHNAAIAGMADRVLKLGDGRIVGETKPERKLSPAEISW